jgi:FkbM family methyltransferase
MPLRDALSMRARLHVRWLSRAPRLLRAVSLRDFLTLERCATAPTMGKPRPVHPRSRGGLEVFVRPGTSDAEVFVAAFIGQFHRPPPTLVPRLIWDLGANVGLTMADLADAFPDAEIVGVEPYGPNSLLAERNVAPWRDRCRIVNAAVWPEDGTVALSPAVPRGQAGVRIEDGSGSTVAVSLDTMLRRFGPPDYVKMDIEGSEARVLKTNTSWASAVHCISVECHPPYTLAECERDLVRLGFVVTTLPQTSRRPAHDTAIGLRPERSRRAGDSAPALRPANDSESRARA